MPARLRLSLPLSIKNIGASTFDGYSFTGSLKIPKFTENIYNNAFYNCQHFDGTLELGSSLKYIGDSAFDGCVGFTGDIVTPNSLTGLGDRVFYNCNSFNGGLVLSNNIKQIGSEAFYNCNSITGDLTIYDTVNSIGDRAFFDCSNFNGVLTISDQTSLGVDVFDGCSFSALGISNSMTVIEDGDFDQFVDFTGSLIIGNKINKIESYAFDGYNFNGTLDITDAVNYIGNYAFSGDTGFVGDLNIGEGTNYLGTGAFYGCAGFDGGLTLSNSLTSINDYSFINCNSLTGGLLIGDNVTYIGESAFENCSGLDGFISMGDNVAAIADRSFANCSSLTGGLVLTDNILTVGIKSFSGCTSINGGLTISDNLISIGDNAFQDVSFNGSLTVGTGFTFGLDIFNGASFTNLSIKGSVDVVNGSDFSFYDDFVSTSSLTILEGATTVSDFSFSGYEWIGSLTLPNSLGGVNVSSFENCSGFDGDLILGNGIGYIEDSAFKNCSFTGDLNIPENVVFIGDDAFFGCDNFNGELTMAGIPLKSVGDRAFFDCSGLVGNINFQGGITGLGESAFYNCSSLDGYLDFNTGSFDKISDNAFYNCNSLTGNLIIPDDVTGVGLNAFSGCSSFNGLIDIPDNIITISDYAFNNCSKLDGSLDLPYSLNYIGDFAFANCTGLDVLCISNIFTSGVAPFNGCDFTELCVGDGVQFVSSGDYDWYKSAPYNFDSQSSLSFGDSLLEIRSGAFSGYGFTGGLVFPPTLEKIEGSSFLNCSSLNGDLNFNLSLENIEANAFSGCLGLSGVGLIIGDLVDVAEGAFSGASFSSLTIKEGVIDTDANEFSFFDDYTTGASLTLPQTLISINSGSFEGIPFTGGLDLPLSVTNVGDRAFYQCSGFTGDLLIPEEVRLGNFAFDQCGFNDIKLEFSGLKVSLETTTIESSGYDYLIDTISTLDLHDGVTDILSGAFSGYDLSGYVDLPTGVDYVGPYAFSNNPLMGGDKGSLEFQCAVTEVGDYAFSGCTGLTGFLLFGTTNSPVPTIMGEDVFEGCDFDILLVPECVSSISSGDYSFYRGLSSGSRLGFQQGVNNIFDNAFADFHFIEKLELPPSLDLIGDSAFKGNTGFFGLEFGGTETFIGDRAFSGCSGISGTVSIPSSVGTIGSYAFANTQTASLELPRGIREIKEYTFKNDINTYSISDFGPGFTEGLEFIRRGAFQNAFRNFAPTWDGVQGNLYFPESLVSIEQDAFKNSSFSGVITIGKTSVVGSQTFQGSFFNTLNIPQYKEVIQPGDYDWFKTLPSAGPSSYAYLAGLQFSPPTTKGTSVIANFAFKDYQFNQNERDLAFPPTLVSIGTGAFQNAFRTTADLDFQYANNLSVIKQSAFEDSAVRTNSFNDLLTTIQSKAFKNSIPPGSASGVLKMPRDLVSIGSEAFYNNQNYTGLIINSSINSIGDDAFRNCSTIQTIDILATTAPTIGTNTFNGMTAVSPAEIHVPSGAVGYAASYDGLTVVDDL
jgi:hypothetical protein